MSSAGKNGRGARLAKALRIDLPTFRGPLAAFEATPRFSGEKGIYLGGDLHAVHTRDAPRVLATTRDRSLDTATVVIDDLEHESQWATAVEAIWCVRLEGPMLDAAPYLTLFDTDGRLRHWLTLLPAREMIGIGHLWLPFVRPRPGGG